MGERLIFLKNKKRRKTQAGSGLNGIHDSIVFHAGTKKDGPTVLTAGGRVLSVTSYGKNKAKALKTTYDNVEKINFDKAYYRKDIGYDIIEEKK